jgi:hypothetical protein
MPEDLLVSYYCHIKVNLSKVVHIYVVERGWSGRISKQIGELTKMTLK